MALPEAALTIVKRYRTCELTTLGKDGAPSTFPVCARLLADGRFLLTTSIGLPQKAFNIRRDPRVSLSFSEPKASGMHAPGAVLVQGDASAEDRIISDISSEPQLAQFFTENIFARQPGGKIMSSWLGKHLFGSYYLRLVIYVTPRRVRYWPTRDFAAAPIEGELPGVG